MIKHKLITLLKGLSREELHKFSRFINSSYFNRSELAIKLYNQIIKYYPGFDNKYFTKENIYLKVSNNREYNDSTFRVLMHDLILLFYKFLVVESFEHDTMHYHVHKIHELNRRGYYKIARGELENSENIKKSKPYDYNLYLSQYFLESYRYNIEYETTKLKKTNKILEIQNTSSSSDLYLVLFFFTELICDYVNNLIFAEKYNIDSKNNATSLIISLLDLNSFLVASEINEDIHRVLDLYFDLYKVYNKPDKKINYLTYKKKVIRYEGKLSHEERTFHYSNLINYLVSRLNEKRNKYLSVELHGIYNQFLKEGLYIDSKTNSLRPSLFRAILLNAIDCKMLDWAESFIRIYTEKVSKDLKENLYHFGYSIFYNEIGKFSEALENLDKIEMDNFIFKYDSYLIRVKIFIQEDNSDRALDCIHAFNEFVRKDVFFNEGRKKLYKSFFKYAKRYLIAKEKYNFREIEYLIKQLGQEKEIVVREWLMNQMKLFMKYNSNAKYRVG